MAVLKEAVEKRKQYIIDFLIDHGVYEAPDGRQLYELPLAELERMYITLRCEIGRESTFDSFTNKR
ncbi:Fur-regulated basic protein FbpA [Geobacillus thermodenitrificans]|uniref:Fur-regulated basic protein FbpA n=1 Tax=Geobacillus thermodenitrificans TaxID=33940 RepID=UPI00399D2C65